MQPRAIQHGAKLSVKKNVAIGLPVHIDVSVNAY